MTSQFGGKSKDIINEDWLQASKQHPDVFQTVSPQKIKNMITSGLSPMAFYEQLTEEEKKELDKSRRNAD